MIELATQKHIPIISSQKGMFELCGQLYAAGLLGLEASWSDYHE
jgi:hypothetical protein